MVEFLDLDQVLRIHQSVIELYGGQAGVRDLGLLQSALAMPRASFEGQPLHPDLFEMAAAYLYHLVQNHPFIDGNKRVGATTAIVFLDLNGILLKDDEPAMAEMTLRVASGQFSKPEIASFFRNLSLPAE